MAYPTPDQWRLFASQAQSLADQYRNDGDEANALRKEEDVDFYLVRAGWEEWRMASYRTPEKQSEAA